MIVFVLHSGILALAILAHRETKRAEEATQQQTTNMCGTAVQRAHLYLIGPVIIAATYFDLDWLLYLLGGATILVHGYLLYNETNIVRAVAGRALRGRGTASVTIPERGNARKEQSLLGPSSSSGCSTCGSRMM